MAQRGVEVIIRPIGSKNPTEGVQEYFVGRSRPLQSLTFQFTRHATSCFNIEIYTDKGLSGKGGIPSLASSGINNTIKLADAYHTTNRFRSSTVCVSNLIRTWMTAVLLYTFPNNKTITLRICPHLRETGWEGNKAYPLASSLPKFLTFLEKIKKHDYYRGLREVILLVREPARWVTIKIVIPKDKNKPVQNDPSFCTIADPLLEEEYTDIGNLTTFMEWYRTLFPEQKELVHVVAHNGIMKKYVKETCKGYEFPNGTTFDTDTYRMKGIPIEKQNCWSFTIPYDPTNDINKRKLIDSIQPGYLNPVKGKGTELKDAQALDNDDPTNSLCFETIKPIDCPKKGGRRTKKRKSYRRKSRSIK